MDMIQRERERREQLRIELAEVARLEAEKIAKLTEEQQRLRDEQQTRELAELAKDRQFLEDLKMPEHLQGIIEEEYLGGAYVLWSTCPHEQTSLARVSLVWNIKYAPPFHKDRENLDDGTYIPQIDRPAGYRFKHIDIIGSSREKRVLLETTLRGSSLARTRTTLSSAVLRDQTSLKQFIASAYLDYPTGYFLDTNCRSWSFSEWVPEAEAVRDRIAFEKESPALVSSSTPPQRPSFFDRFLGRS